jgi:protease I
MNQRLSAKRIAVLVENGFEHVELTEPRKALHEAGAQARIVSPVPGQVCGWNHTEWGESLPVEVPLDQADPNDFDAFLLPGGVINPDKLRMNPKAVQFVKAFFDAGKPVAAICHGPWTVLEAGEARGRTMTSWPSLRTDLRNAGATWVDQEVVESNGLVTSRKPDDLPAFNREKIRLFAQDGQAKRRAA